MTEPDTADRPRYTQTSHLWCGRSHEAECAPGVCPVTPRSPKKLKCDCLSHDPVDHQGACGHCGAVEDQHCAPECPVDGED